ncbi:MULTISPECIES: alpha/beta hydrolase [Novosphingobium]|uniref:alpha/beta hydrolase n=1 Tax=Novosphingobium sp. RL4 TaxID=3109595 RepID=UPI002D769989|nr:alpha/beta fold hydrolase [Novosphingobium sp. RL4]WRT95936.1 alpha/beta fold hydrolase [Novosphingobium sp. RL4]
MTGSNLQAAAPQERDATVTVSGVEIAGRFTMPQGTAHGAVLLLPGSLYSDVDGNYPSMNVRPHAYADLARQLGERGFVVLRMAKIGPGTGSRTIDAEAARRHIDFLTRVEVAQAGLDLLRRTVQTRPVIVAGHSEGSVVASLLAAGRAGTGIDGVVSLSGPALPILSILRAQVAGMPPPDVAPDMTMFDCTAAAIRAGEAPSDEAKSDPQTGMLASMPEPGLAYLRSADRVDPIVALAQVKAPVLIVQGGRDDSVPAAHADMLRAGRTTQPTEVATFPNLTHFYKVAPPGLTPMQSMGLKTQSDPAVANVIAEWASHLRR